MFAVARFRTEARGVYVIVGLVSSLRPNTLHNHIITLQRYLTCQCHEVVYSPSPVGEDGVRVL